jgi:hypothetical protein
MPVAVANITAPRARRNIRSVTTFAARTNRLTVPSVFARVLIAFRPPSSFPILNPFIRSGIVATFNTANRSGHKTFDTKIIPEFKKKPPKEINLLTAIPDRCTITMPLVMSSVEKTNPKASDFFAPLPCATQTQESAGSR